MEIYGTPWAKSFSVMYSVFGGFFWWRNGGGQGGHGDRSGMQPREPKTVVSTGLFTLSGFSGMFIDILEEKDLAFIFYYFPARDDYPYMLYSHVY